MKAVASLIGPLIGAHILLAMSFAIYPSSFWPLFTVSSLLLAGYALVKSNIVFKKPSLKYMLISIGSGILLYLAFKAGKAIVVSQIPYFENQLHSLYTLIQPNKSWHYFVLFAVIIPAEELFWRGFIQKKFSLITSSNKAILFAAILYASAHVYSGTVLLVFAALFAGTIWGYLYEKSGNLIVPLISHVLFDYLLLILFPLL
ncbi:CPBP family intramembrane glutamic endopeptidase [Pseudalkalibacillus caeni]|nr:type II CAAX endopeptidase family protein [Pseudalkalibacillus caeni]